MAKYCEHCGAPVATPFCTKCGTRASTTGNSSEGYPTSITRSLENNSAVQNPSPAIPVQSHTATSLNTKDQLTNPKNQPHSALARTQGGIGSTSLSKGPHSSSFSCLIERSITAWNSLAYFASLEDKKFNFDAASGALRRCKSVDDLLRSNILFWFFQTKQSFMQQTVFTKWNPDKLEEYILLPVATGFVNKKDCFFVSHYWRTPEHPDPKGDDSRLVRGDIGSQDWSYVWVDWTCMPQAPRSTAEKAYFKNMLARISVLIRETGYAWRFPDFRPRLWVLYEVAEFVLSGTAPWTDSTPDIAPFVTDVLAMMRVGVSQVIQQRGYHCTNSSDAKLVMGWLEALVILVKIVPQPMERRTILDYINRPGTGSCAYYCDTGVIKVDKARGIISHNESTYTFTPVFEVGFPASHGTPVVSASTISKSSQSPALDHSVVPLSNKKGIEPATNKYNDTGHSDKSENASKRAVQRQNHSESYNLWKHGSVEAALGLKRPETLAAMAKRSLVLGSEGENEAAREMLLEMRDEGVPSSAYLNQLTNMHKKALELENKREYVAAEELHLELLERRKKALGPEHPDTLRSMGHLATVLRIQQKFDNAANVYTLLLELNEMTLGPDHSDVLATMNNLGVTLEMQRKPTEAKEMFRQHLERKVKVLGPNHPGTFSAKYNLTSMLGSDEYLQMSRKVNSMGSPEATVEICRKKK